MCTKAIHIPKHHSVHFDIHWVRTEIYMHTSIDSCSGDEGELWLDNGS